MPTFRGDDGVSVTRGGGDVCPLPPEYHSPIHRNSADIRAVSGGGAPAGIAVCAEMVGSDRSGPGGREIGGGGNV